MLFPICGKLTAQHQTQQRSIFRILFFVLSHETVPLAFKFSPALHCLPKMRKRLIGHKEMLVFGPTKVTFCFADGLFTWRITVRFARSLSRHSEADDSFD